MIPAIQAQHITFGYRRDRPVLRDVCFEVPPGDFLAVAGPNGAGKSTLLDLLAGLRQPQSGEILLADRNLRSCSVAQIARRVAVVRQEFIPAFGFTVEETVLMARTLHYGRWGFESPADRQLVRRALELTETTAFATRGLGSLSAGERQRVFIARGLAQDTPILLLDEPTSFLDLKHQVRIYDLLKSIQQEKGTTIVAITHDLNLAAQYCDETLLLSPGGSSAAPGPHFRIGKTSEVLTPEAVERAFEIRLFSGMVGRARFLFPLGRKAQDSDRPDPPA
ncbi:MAG: ABC transporter ATP-binding protein [Planctomycetes bacterium]|jgi:iron complex transport system ATP-binding protein|nr:ABC transporter ATP-binding protein [Planctomycetota bacterium]